MSGVGERRNVPGDHATTLQSLPQIFCDRFVRDLVISDFFLHLELPSQHFLVGQSVKELAGHKQKPCTRTREVVQPERRVQQSMRYKDRQGWIRPSLATC